MSREKQSTLLGFFGKPKSGPAPPRPSSAAKGSSTVASSPVSTALKTPSSVPNSSPAVASSSQMRQPQQSPILSTRAASRLKVTAIEDESDEALSPPPTIVKAKKRVPKSSPVKPIVDKEESMDVDVVADGSPQPNVGLICDTHLLKTYARAGERKEKFCMPSRTAKDQIQMPEQ